MFFSNCCAVATSSCRACTSSIEADQIPVEIESRGDGGDHLLLELQIGDLQIVLLHADIAAVHRRSEAVQQILRDLQIEIAAGIRIQAEGALFNLRVGAGVGELAQSARMDQFCEYWTPGRCACRRPGRWFR